MRIKNKEIRRRRHRKEQAIKAAVKEAKSGGKPVKSSDAPAAKKPAEKKATEKKPAAKKPAAKKAPAKKKAEEKTEE